MYTKNITDSMVQLYIRQACYLNVSHAIVYAAVMTLTP